MHPPGEAPLNVLVVDDDRLIRTVLRAALEAEGFQCDEASGGGDALRAFAASPPDACLLDLTLADMEGLAVLQAIRARPEWTGCRVFILSGRDDPSMRARALELGAEACLSKPVSAVDLARTLRGG